MDPKPKAYLDPKLKEAYDSVMGRQTKREAQQPPQPPILPPSGPQIISQPPIFSPQPSVASNEVHKPVIVAYNSQAQKEKALNNKVSWRWTLMIVVALVLLLVYFFFWAKLLDIKIPFLS